MTGLGTPKADALVNDLLVQRLADGTFIRNPVTGEIDYYSGGVRRYVTPNVWATVANKAFTTVSPYQMGQIPPGSTYAPEGSYISTAAPPMVYEIGGGQRHYVFADLRRRRPTPSRGRS